MRPFTGQSATLNANSDSEVPRRGQSQGEGLAARGVSGGSASPSDLRSRQQAGHHPSIINADIFLLTPDRPNLLHGEGLEVNVSQPADDLLLSDLRSDENMEWIPDQGWFTHLILETDASNLTYDLSVGVGDTPPSFVDAGFTRIEPCPARPRPSPLPNSISADPSAPTSSLPTGIRSPSRSQRSRQRGG